MNFIRRLAILLAKPRVVLLTGVLFLAAFLVVNVTGVPGLMRSEALDKVGILDMDYGYTPQKAHFMLGAYEQEGRAAYRQFLLRVDFVFPAIVGLFFCAATLAVLSRLSPERTSIRMLCLIPVGLIFFDWAENASILALLSAYPTRMPVVARIASVFTLLKAASGIASLLLLLGSSALLLVKSLRSRSLRS